MKREQIPKYPFKHVEELRFDSENDLKRIISSLSQQETASMAGDLCDEAEAFHKKEVVAIGSNRPERDKVPPKWISALIAKGATKEEIFDNMLERVRRAPSERTLLLAEELINEIGKERGSGEFLQSRINKDLLRELYSLTSGGK